MSDEAQDSCREARSRPEGNGLDSTNPSHPQVVQGGRAGDRVRILVCGSNYGVSYLDAIDRAPSSLTTVGLLARGSERSQALAAARDLPLYHRVNEVPEGIDLVCAALHSSADGVVLEMVERGLDILCEHPRSHAFLREVLAAAERRGSLFHVNGHFADLPGAGAFIARCREESTDDAPKFVGVDCGDRGLWATFDILAHAGFEVDPCSLYPVARTGPFVRIAGLAAGRPLDLNVQSGKGEAAVRLEDGRPEYFLDCRITIGFSSGLLTLLSLVGPVVWNVNFNRGLRGDRPFWELTQSQPMAPQEFQDARAAANLKAIQRLVRQAAEGGSVPGQDPQDLLHLGQTWDAVRAILRS